MNDVNTHGQDDISYIDFKKIKEYLKKNTYRIKFQLIFAVAVVGLIFMVRLVVAPPMSSYSQVLSFTFPQSEKGTYPNGAPFSLSDIVNGNVLENVWQSNNLESQGISLKEFSDYVSIVPFAENAQFIRAKYQTMLARKGLNNAEISVLEREFNLELEKEGRKNVMLSVTVPFTSPISGSLAKKIVSDIPKAWSQQAIKKLGVISLPIVEAENVKDEIQKSGSPFQIVDYFYKSADALNHSLTTISNYPGGETLKDSETGLSVLDLKQRISDLNRYWILDFDNYLQQRNQPSEIDIRSAEIRLKELQDKKSKFLGDAKTYKASLQDYDSLKQSNPAQEIAMRNQQNGSNLQLQGDSVQKLIDLGSQNKDAEFRQELVKKRVEAELKANDMDQEIIRLDRRVIAARKGIQKNNIDPEKFSFYTSEIWTQLIYASKSIKRIQAVQASKFSDGDGQLFTASSVNKAYASSISGILFTPVIGLFMIFFAIMVGHLARSVIAKEQPLVSA